MQSISNLASGVSKAVWGEDSTRQQSGTEPVSGETGKGTTTEPFDAGNAPEQAQSNIDTSAPTAATTTAPTSSTLGTDRPTNARKPSFAGKDTATEPATAPLKEDTTVKPLTEPGSSDAVNSDTTPSEAVATTNAQKNVAYETKSPFDDTKTPDSSEPTANLNPSKTRSRTPERSISPGARPDGSHAETGKPEKSKFSSKIKEKFHIGSKH